MEISLMRYLPTFVRAAEELSFSAAARRLGVTPGAVSKSVRALESGLGVRLFHRSTHAMELTEDGEHLLKSAAPLLAQLDGTLETIRASPDRARGTLRVAAPYGFGKQFIVPLLADFSARYPDVVLELRFEDHPIDLIEARIDVGIGARLEPRGELVCRKLCDSRLFTVASPAFVERHGRPRNPHELERYLCIGYRSPSSGKLRPFYYRGEEGADSLLTVNPTAAVIGTDQELVCELAVQGLGIANVGWVALPYIEAGTLVPLLEDYTPELPPMMIYYQSRQNVPPKVRAFIDHMEASSSVAMPRRAESSGAHRTSKG
jgi:DNA-binding transcriptional LysR family regulator